MSVVFVTGPVRSGKSALGVRLATESGREVTYLATAAHEPDDAEWRARLERHRRDRPAVAGHAIDVRAAGAPIDA